MDPTTSLVTAIAAKTGGAALDVVKGETKGFLKLLLGPSLKAVGESFAVRHNERLFGNVVEAVARAMNLMKERGLSPNQVPLKIIHPLLDCAALEEDPDLRGTWGNLLANAADPRESDLASPSFPIMLRELSARDVKFLDALYDFAQVIMPSQRVERTADVHFDLGSLMDIYVRAGLSRDPRLPNHASLPKNQLTDNLRASIRDYEYTLAVARRQSILVEKIIGGRPEALISKAEKSLLSGQYPRDIFPYYHFTEIGSCFVAACQPPKKNSAQ